MNPESSLPAFRLTAGTSIAQAQPAQAPSVSPESPALDVMTDLTQVKAATTQPSTSLHEAEQTMIYQGVRMLFVVNEMPSLVGLITTTDLRGDRAMRIVGERGIRHDELSVADVMTPLDRLDAIDYADIRRASVGNVVATLKRFGRNHLLVVESASRGGPSRVRGVLSRTQIERQLGHAIALTPIASTFSEIEQALH